MYIEWVLVAHNTQWGMIFFIISWMNEGCHLTKQPWPSLPYLRLLVCILNDPSWKMLWTSAEIRSPSCPQKISISLQWTSHRKTCRYFLILSSSSAPRLRSSPPGRLTGQLCMVIDMLWIISNFNQGVKSNLRKGGGRHQDEIGCQPSISFVELQPPFPQPHHLSRHCT